MAGQKLEELIREVLTGAARENALELAAYLRANEMTVGAHGEVGYKGSVMCYIHIDGLEEQPGPWTVWTEGDYSNAPEDSRVDEQTKEIAHANVNFCASCGGDCRPGKRKLIFGKEFDHVCSADMAFNNPDARTIDCIKKLLEIRKNDILLESRRTS